MFDWLNGPGAELKHHIPGSTNYVTQLRNRRGGESNSESSGRRDDAESGADYGLKSPFPLNPQFVSEPILSEELSNEIYKRVVEQKKSVRSVSVEMRVDMRRVGAVVRLKELEKRMKNEVCYFFITFHSPPKHSIAMMSINRLVFKTRPPSRKWLLIVKNYNSLKQYIFLSYIKTLYGEWLC